MDLSTPLDPQAALSLALAVVAHSNAPLLLLDGELKVVEASGSFCRAFDIDAASIRGRPFRDLGSGEWDLPDLVSTLETAVRTHSEIRAYEMKLAREGREPRHLVLNGDRLDYADETNARLILAISDITEARLSEQFMDNLLREKAILLEKIQRRVANSLQVIAAVLLQFARGAQLGESPGGVPTANPALKPIADVQQHLLVTTLGDVPLRPYLTDLCRSLGASMIRDHAQLSLDVSVDESVAEADESVSLGLIVTELVINALRHAFPGHRTGRILVDYRSAGPHWTLSVSDNGVGLPPGRVTPRLGSTIVEALARRLHARIQIGDAHPGMIVSVAHT
ncbi:MAG: sensor histidine kinase [Caulobacteraceae bacterium]